MVPVAETEPGVESSAKCLMGNRARPCGRWGRVVARNRASGYGGARVDTPLGLPIRRVLVLTTWHVKNAVIEAISPRMEVLRVAACAPQYPSPSSVLWASKLLDTVWIIRGLVMGGP